jgi:acid stress-induced BolA-like protein IbaG/YrbA
MNSEQLTQILKEAFPEAEVAVSGQAGKFDLRIVDDQFDGKRTVAHQQLVYAPLNTSKLYLIINCILKAF